MYTSIVICLTQGYDALSAALVHGTDMEVVEAHEASLQRLANEARLDDLRDYVQHLQGCFCQ